MFTGLATTVASAALLAWSVSEGVRPLDRQSLAAALGSPLPPLPVIGAPGAVEPEREMLEVTPQTAKEINASRPFSKDELRTAAPFAHDLAPEDEERAVACLAAAGLYEAGANSGDQTAVMQVVLNRVRHPAFPASVCNVVFQGSERSTGCQFTFTCDGSLLRRKPGARAWQAASSLARAMLSGQVDRRVGLATHYHTDWVVPYWSASLEKVTNIRTHLFFRWPGYWGTPSAFRRGAASREPLIEQLADFSPVHRTSGETEVAAAPATTIALLSPGFSSHSAAKPSLASTTIKQLEVERLALAPGTGAGRWALTAVALCSEKPTCRVLGWSVSANEPGQIDQTSLLASPPDLVFIKVALNRQQQAYWDCEKWPKAAGSRCLSNPADTARLIFAD